MSGPPPPPPPAPPAPPPPMPIVKQTGTSVKVGGKRPVNPRLAAMQEAGKAAEAARQKEKEAEKQARGDVLQALGEEIGVELEIDSNLFQRVKVVVNGKEISFKIDFSAIKGMNPQERLKYLSKLISEGTDLAQEFENLKRGLDIDYMTTLRINERIVAMLKKELTAIADGKLLRDNRHPHYGKDRQANEALTREMKKVYSGIVSEFESTKKIDPSRLVSLPRVLQGDIRELKRDDNIQTAARAAVIEIEDAYSLLQKMISALKNLLGKLDIGGQFTTKEISQQEYNELKEKAKKLDLLLYGMSVSKLGESTEASVNEGVNKEIVRLNDEILRLESIIRDLLAQKEMSGDEVKTVQKAVTSLSQAQNTLEGMFSRGVAPRPNQSRGVWVKPKKAAQKTPKGLESQPGPSRAERAADARAAAGRDKAGGRKGGAMPGLKK